ncbi:MAG TPA: amidase [Gammaproteobacteria bacterium]|nr:amidase [Gammaproteobacteria bacterium]|tara:strand:+ start:11432 stop:12874 length:1443 start_codon:yes stop_codon:yes gene_type:complete
MLTQQEYLALDATDMSHGLKRGDFTPSDLIALAIEQAQKINPSLNAITSECYEKARQNAAELDKAKSRQSMVAGLPFLIKDLSPLDGQLQSNGSRLFQGFMATRSSSIVQKYLDAGLVILGKTNTPEFGLTLTTEPVANGATRNPWNLDFSTGGSSGGAAAAVAAGIVPVAHATDGGGSIRIPASCCGLFGLKPSRGLTAIENDLGDCWSGMSVGHVVSRSVRDSALFLDVVTLAEANLFPKPATPMRFTESISKIPDSLRIAVQEKHPFGEPIDSECLKALEKTMQLCGSLGHHIEEIEHPVDHKAATAAMNTLVCIHTYQSIKKRLDELDTDLEAADLETSTRQMAQMGTRFSAIDYLKARETLRAEEIKMRAFHAHYDVLLSPVLTKTTAKLGWLDMNAQELSEYSARYRSYSGFTALYNGTGQPSASLPLYSDENGLPIGVMATAAWGNDALLMQFARQLEEAEPWPLLAPLANAE